jgi:hypothetical protein
MGMQCPIYVKLFFDNSVKLYNFSILGYEESCGAEAQIPHLTRTAFWDSFRSALFFLCRLDIGAFVSKSW